MESKLNLNWALVEQARASAKKVAEETQAFIDRHTTVTVERAVCRLLGIDGIWLAITVAETLTLLVTGALFLAGREKYHYT